jgi:hypothetical protein
MEPDAYYIAGNDGQPEGPFTKEELQHRAGAGLLEFDTLIAWPHAKEWVKASKLLKRGAFLKSVGVTDSQRRKVLAIVGAVLGLLLMVFGTIGVWKYWTKNVAEEAGGQSAEADETVSPQEERVSENADSVHPMARWYLFGYLCGSQRRAVNDVLSAPQDPRESDLSYVFDALGCERIEADQFQLAFRGYRDALDGEPTRYVVPAEVPEDGFPSILESVADFRGESAIPSAK